MKNLIKLLPIAIALLFLATSCEKEGVYNPKQKIAHLYATQTTTQNGVTTTIDKYLWQNWNWDKNLLTSIDYYMPDGSLWYTESYQYDNQKRLIEISSTQDSKYAITYDGKHLSHIDCFYESELGQQIDFFYDGSLLTEIKSTIFEDKGKSARLLPAVLQFIPNLPEQAANHILAKINSTKSGNMISTYKIEWAGKNISKITEDMSSDYFSFTVISEYTYDNKRNPFKNLFSTTFNELYNANNVVKDSSIQTYSLSDDVFHSYTEYQYTYEGDYPTSKTYLNNGNTYTIARTEYYEYK